MSQMRAAGAKGSERLQYNGLSLCILKTLPYLCVVNHNKSLTQIQKHLGKIILSLKILSAAFLAQSRSTCHLTLWSQIALQSTGHTVTFTASCSTGTLIWLRHSDAVGKLKVFPCFCFLLTGRVHLVCSVSCCVLLHCWVKHVSPQTGRSDCWRSS